EASEESRKHGNQTLRNNRRVDLRIQGSDSPHWNTPAHNLLNENAHVSNKVFRIIVRAYHQVVCVHEAIVKRRKIYSAICLLANFRVVRVRDYADHFITFGFRIERDMV